MQHLQKAEFAFGMTGLHFYKELLRDQLLKNNHSKSAFILLSWHKKSPNNDRTICCSM